MIDQSIAVTVHGRYLVEPSAAPSAPVLVGFHGYAEPADLHMERLRAIPGAERWVLVSIQGLHRFYRGRSNDVVASWMTRQDREHLIADNRDYVAAVLADVQRRWNTSPVVVFSGFSQGVATAFRAATAADEMLLDDPVEHRRIAVAVPRAFRVDDRDRSPFADAQAVRFRAEHAAALRQALFLQAALQVLPRGEAALPVAALGRGLVGTDEDVAARDRHADAVGQLFESTHM